MKRLTVLLVLAAAIIIASTSIAATDPNPNQQVAQLKRQLRTARLDLADANDQIDAQNQVMGDQADTIQRLRNRLANQPDPLDVITSRGPDGLWQAMVAIWQAFPTLDPGALCGYDKSNTPADAGDGLTLTSWTFYKWSGC